VAFASEDESVLTMHAWSQEAMRQCAIGAKPLTYEVAHTGLWGEAVRQRRPVITNDYAAPNPLKKGTPEGHVHVLRHMNVPILDGGRIVIVAGVGNKNEDYDEDDVRQLKLLMEGMWRIVRRNHAEKALQDSEKRFKAAFHTSPDAVNINRFSDGLYVDVNMGFTELTGFSREDVIGKKSLDINIWYDPIDRERLAVALKKQGYVRNLEAPFRLKDGRIRTGLISARLIELEGQPHILSVTRDVDDWKKAEAERSRLVTAIEQAGENIVITDPEGKIVYVNPAFEATTGYTRAEVIGQNPRILKSGKHDKAFYKDMWETLLSGNVWRGRFTNQRKDGSLYEETATLSPVKDETGQIINFVAVKRDVTFELILQQQLLQAQKMEAVGTLAGGIAHDFNNLLQAILGYTDILLTKKAPGDPDRPKLEIVHQAALDGADLVARILTFSKKAEAKVRPIDLNVEIRRVEKLLQRTLSKMITVKLDLADDLRIVDSDPAQLEQVLLNLAVNSQHAMPDGGNFLIETSNVKLSDEYSRAQLGAKGTDCVLVNVSDTGMGIPSYLVDRIFEPFFTTKADGVGTGLGLAMVHGIVSQLGGFIRCHSEPGKGTSFRIYFPVSKTEKLLEVVETVDAPERGNEKILLVDDDQRVREMAYELLEGHGYQVLLARSGEEGVAIYGAHKEELSLVILDLIMPGMGGKKCLEELLRIDPDVKVLVASGYSPDASTKDCVEQRAKGFVSKPFRFKELLKQVRKTLDES
jgi:PAS domain S-box-containing protein